MVNNNWRKENNPWKTSPSAVTHPPPTCLSHPKEKAIYMLVPQATGGSFLNVSKIPSVPLPEKAIYASSFHGSNKQESGVLSSIQGSAIDSPWPWESHLEQMSKMLCDSSQHSLWRLWKNQFSEICMGKSTQKLGQKKAQQQHCHVCQFWLQKEHESIKKELQLYYATATHVPPDASLSLLLLTLQKTSEAWGVGSLLPQVHLINKSIIGYKLGDQYKIHSY